MDDPHARGKLTALRRRGRLKAVADGRSSVNDVSRTICAERLPVRTLIGLQCIQAGPLGEGVILGKVELLILRAAGDSVRFGGARVAIASCEVPGDERLPVQNDP